MIVKRLLIGGLFFSTLLFSGDDQKLVKKALRIHQRALTVDTHCDTPIMLTLQGMARHSISADRPLRLTGDREEVASCGCLWELTS